MIATGLYATTCLPLELSVISAHVVTETRIKSHQSEESRCWIYPVSQILLHLIVAKGTCFTRSKW
jgi:hypothetical protein